MDVRPASASHATRAALRGMVRATADPSDSSPQRVVQPLVTSPTRRPSSAPASKSSATPSRAMMMMPALDYEDADLDHQQRWTGSMTEEELTNSIAKALKQDDYSFILSLAGERPPPSSPQQQQMVLKPSTPARSGGNRCMRKAYMPCACPECLSRQRGPLRGGDRFVGVNGAPPSTVGGGHAPATRMPPATKWEPPPTPPDWGQAIAPAIAPAAAAPPAAAHVSVGPPPATPNRRPASASPRGRAVARHWRLEELADDEPLSQHKSWVREDRLWQTPSVLAMAADDDTPAPIAPAIASIAATSSRPSIEEPSSADAAGGAALKQPSSARLAADEARARREERLSRARPGTAPANRRKSGSTAPRFSAGGTLLRQRTRSLMQASVATKTDAMRAGMMGGGAHASLEANFNALAESWLDPVRKQRALVAATEFDVRHRTHKHDTVRAMKDANLYPDDRVPQSGFKAKLIELVRNRYAEKELPTKGPQTYEKREAKPKEVAQKKWRLEDSIWAGRQFRGGENRGFYDNDDVVRRSVQCDFGRALGKGLLQGFLLKHDANAPDPNTQPEELKAFLQEVEDVFCSHGRLFFMVFDYFASLGASDDLFHIHRGGYDQMVQQCGMQVKGSKHCDLAHLDIIFVLVNASGEAAAGKDAGAATKAGMKQGNPRGGLVRQGTNKDLTAGGGGGGGGKAMKHDSRHGLTRAELVQCLCRIAIARYVLTPKTAKTPKAGKTDVSDAIEELMRTLRQKASREVCQDGQMFRRENCYTEATDLALRAHEPALRLLFAKYSSGEGIGGGGAGGKAVKKTHSTDSTLVAGSDKLLSPGEWICLCRELGLIDNDLSMEDCRLIFMWSRMRVIDEDDPKRRQRIENLTFWGFLEAIIRVAQSKAMPTPEEVSAAGFKDGGDFMINLRTEDPSAYRAFLKANDREWWQQTRQPISAKLSILLSLVMRTLAKNLQRWEKDGSAAKARKDTDNALAKADAASKNAAPQAASSEGGGVGGGGPPPAAGYGDGLLEGFSGGDGGLSMESLSKLSNALDEQANVLNGSAITIQAICRGFLARVGFNEERQRAAVIRQGTPSPEPGAGGGEMSLDARLDDSFGGGEKDKDKRSSRSPSPPPTMGSGGKRRSARSSTGSSKA